MNNLKYGLFDLFVYALPGSLLISTMLISTLLDDKTLVDLIKLLKENVNVYFFISFIVISNIKGFILNSV